ncbi:MAG: DUF2232 domain-containing protein [Clostridia bacterium]|nr:DUF2232 domain-containing protein [Clostridia bacterium]
MRSTEWKNGVHTHAARSVMLVAALAFSLLCQVNLGMFTMLATVAFTLLFMFDDGRRLYSIVASILSLVLVGILQWLLLPTCVVAIGIGVCIAWFYRTGRPKFDVAILSVGLYCLMFCLVFWMSAAYEISDASPAAAIAYYTEQFTAIKESLLSEWNMMLSEVVNEQSAEYSELFSTVLDSVFTYVPAIVAVLAFAMVGVCFKLVSAIVCRLSADGGEQMRRWSFATPVLFAYFYGVVFLLSIFIVGDSVFALAVGNLQLFFMCMYAYVGFKYLRFVSRRTRRRHPMTIVIIVLFFLMPSVAIQLLSLEGVIAVITAHRMQKNRGSGAGPEL